MTRNENNTDRAARVLLAAVLLAAAVWGAGIASTAGVVLAVVAGVLLVTGAVGFCPLYPLLGVATYPTPGRTRGSAATHHPRG